AAPAHRDFRAAGRPGQLRLAGRARRCAGADVHRRSRQRHRKLLTMIRLDLSSAPKWLDLGAGLRLHVLPVTTAIMVAARNDPAVDALPEAASKEEQALVMAKAVARRVVTGWEGVGDADGNPVPVTSEGIDALLDIWPVFETFQTRCLTDRKSVV